MITECAHVVSVEGRWVITRVKSKQTCERCAQGIGCGSGLMAFVLKNRLHDVKARALDKLKPGDLVQLEFSEKALLLAAFLSYLLPAITLLLGALLAQSLVPNQDLPVVLGGVAGFSMGLVVARWVSSSRSLAQVVTPSARLQV